jgi:2-methylcitrate dehydratase PrpD
VTEDLTVGTLVQRLGALAASTRLDTLPAQVRNNLPQRVLDTVGVAIAATRLETSTSVMEFAEETGGRPASTAIGLVERTSAPLAAFVNGVLAHSLDFDDTHLPSILHPSASIVPATLATGEACGSGGAEVLAAIAVGIEITIRVGMAGYSLATPDAPGQSVYFEHGQHATSICGAIGAAAASASLRGLDAQGCAHAMAVAASMASGIIEANRTGGTVKRIHCGWAAQAGVTAAMLVARGITGAPTALEGRFGLFEALLRDEWRAEPITEDLGTRWNVAEVFYKPYPANHFTHAGIDAAMRLRAKGLRADEIASAHLCVASATVRTIGEPLAAKQTPETGYQAQFSGPFTVAAALTGGSGLGLGLTDFTDARAQDPQLRSLMAKITVGGSEECDAIYPNQFPAILDVTTNDGRRLVEKVLENRGGPLRPLSDAELRSKFMDNTSGVIDAEAAQRVIDAVESLAEVPAGADAVRSILRPIASAR